MRLCRIIEQYWTSWYLEAREIFLKGFFLVNSPFNFFLLNGNTSYGWVSYTFTQPSPLSAIQTSETFWRVCSFQLYVECSSASWASNWFSVLGSLTPGSPPHPLTRPNTNRQEGFSCPSRPLLFPLCGNYIIIKDTILANISCWGK